MRGRWRDAAKNDKESGLWRIKTESKEIVTKRLLLRKLHKEDRGFFYKLLRDQKVNRFLPWFPVKSMEETEQFLKEKYLAVYENGQGYAYVICLKESGMPVGIKRFIRRN